MVQSKDQLSALQSLAAVFALVVGAGWVLIHFDILSELIPEVSIRQTVKAYKALDDAIILQVDATLTNSSKRSATYYCRQTYILELLPLSKENMENLRGSMAQTKGFDLEPMPMKAIYNGVRIVVPANSSISESGVYAVSPYARQYISIDDTSTKIKSIIVTTAYYTDPHCLPKLKRHENLSSYTETSSIFDIESNTSEPSTQVQKNDPSSLP